MIKSLLVGLRSPDKILAAADRDLAKGRPAKAFAAVKTLAESGNPDGQVRLARMYQNGEGVLQSFPSALKWFRSAAEQGSVAAQNELGIIYLAGRAQSQAATAAAAAQYARLPACGGSRDRP
jgi:TPR repeat protein